ncbi:unnamed protein product [Malus baccata var. baccata]
MAEQRHPLRLPQSPEAMGSPIQGMESVIATVSGYHGSERFNLIKLISRAGASYVGAMSRSTTHLVCWKFEGRKYELANKFDAKVVNHRWIEECIKQGKRVPERPYTLRCGQEVGPLLLQPPPVVTVGESSKKWNALSDKSNGYDDSVKIIDSESGASRRHLLAESRLLDENLFPAFKENSSSHKAKQKHVGRNSKQELRSSSRHCLEDPPLTRSLRREERVQESSTHLVRAKRNIFSGKESSMAETSRKGRKLIKRNIGRRMVESELSESDQECHPIRFQSTRNDVITVLSDDSDEERNDNILETERDTDNGLYIGRRIRNGLKGVEEADRNHPSSSKPPNISVEDEPTALEETPRDEWFEVENSKEECEGRFETEAATKIPSMELSCVICWTEYSSIRGILPCGHRFCYSCIENWAGHMSSRRKNSTCPLCKASFTCITKVDDADMIDQKIFSQTIPSAPKMDIPVPTYRGPPNFSAPSISATACSVCRQREPVDLLFSCDVCCIRCIHNFCLDPPLFPWTCIHCKDLRRLYLHSY